LLSLSEIQGIDSEITDELRLRIDLATEPAGAKRWGATALGGVFIHGENGRGKTSLARAIVAPADLQWHIRAADIIDETSGNSTSKHLRSLGNNIRLATKDGYSLGVVLDEIQPVLEKMSSGVVREEVRDFVRRAVLNPTVLLVATMSKRPGTSSPSPNELLRSASLNGHELFDLQIHMENPAESRNQKDLKNFYSKAVMDQMKDELVDGRPAFEVPSPEGLAILIEGLIREGSTLADIEHAVLICRANKFREQRKLNGEFPGSITIQDIADVIAKSRYTEVESTSDAGNLRHLR
jgi:SpoVK/Ycf46/Vps4 family AAA+-type ATPase